METFCQIASNPGEVKRAGRNVDLVSNWEIIKKLVMMELVEKKFRQEPYRTLLLNTGDEEIQEGNWWGDKYWGVCLKTLSGQNTLGIIIMNMREKLKHE